MESYLKVLKAMSEITGHKDMNQFAEAVALTPQQTADQMKFLANKGFVKKIGSGYAITDKGKAALKAIAPVELGKEFQFYETLGKPTGSSASTIVDFYEIVQNIVPESLEFHLYRGDFENWIGSAINDSALASDFSDARAKGLKGEELREALCKALEAKHGFLI